MVFNIFIKINKFIIINFYTIIFINKFNKILNIIILLLKLNYNLIKKTLNLYLIKFDFVILIIKTKLSFHINFFKMIIIILK